MTESEYMASVMTISDAGIYLGNIPIMPASEDGWIQGIVRELCRRYRPKTVLELGFGLGLSADEFQRQGIERHIIIEPHPAIIARAHAWADGKSGVTIIDGFAQTVDPPDEPIDLLFDDRYEFIRPLDSSRFRATHEYVCPGMSGATR